MSHSSLSPTSGTAQVLHECSLNVRNPQMPLFFNALGLLLGEAFEPPEWGGGPASQTNLEGTPVVWGLTSLSLHFLFCKMRIMTSNSERRSGKMATPYN